MALFDLFGGGLLGGNQAPQYIGGIGGPLGDFGHQDLNRYVPSVRSGNSGGGGFLGGLLGGGGSSLDIYGDLFTDEQKKALKAQQLTSTLAKLSQGFAKAAMPSRMPIPLGAALGEAAGAAAGGGDEASERMLKAMQVAEQVKQSRQEREILQKYGLPMAQRIAAGLGVPVQTVLQHMPAGAPGGAGAPIGAPPGSNAPPLPPIAAGDYSGATGPGPGPLRDDGYPAEPSPAAPGGPPGAFTPGAFGVPSQNLSRYGLSRPPAQAPGMPPPINPRAAGAEFGFPVPPGSQTGLLPPPIDQPPGQGLLAAAGGSTGSYDPFDPAAPGAAGGLLPDPRGIRIEQLSGQAAPVLAGETLRQTAPVPSLGGRALPASAWQQGLKYDVRVPYGQDPNDVLPGRGGVNPGQDPELARLSQLMRVGTVASPAGSAGREARVKFWTDQGMPQHVAEGIADRVGAESRYNPNAIGDGGASGGLYQHHADRLARLKAFAAQQNLPWTDPGVQDRFAATEVRGGDAIATRGFPAVAAAPDRQTAAKLWDQFFERSATGPGSGGGRRVQVEPLGGEAVPAGAAPALPPGTIPGTNVTAQQLAALNAILKMGGMKSDVFGSLLQDYYKTPGYLGEVARTEAGARKDVELQMDPLIKEQTRRAELKVETELKPALEAAIEKAKSPVLLERTQAEADIARLSKQLEQAGAAGFTPVPDTPVIGPDGQPTKTTISQFEIARRQAAAAERRAAGDTTPRPGDIASTPIYTPEQTQEVQAQGAAKTEMYKSGLKALDTAHDAVRAANQRAPYYGTMLTAMQGFQPGATAEARLTAMQYLRDLGIIKGDSVPQGEALKLAGERLAFLAVPPNQGSWSNVERQSLKASIPGMATSPEGLAQAIGLMQQLDNYDRKVSEIHRKVADENRGLPNILEAQRRIEALGPPLTPAQEAALAAASGAAPPAVTPPPTATPPATGAIKTPYGTITPVR